MIVIVDCMSLTALILVDQELFCQYLQNSPSACRKGKPIVFIDIAEVLRLVISLPKKSVTSVKVSRYVRIQQST